MKNLFIFYSPEENSSDYEKFQSTIKALDNWVELSPNFFYIRSPHNSQMLAEHIFSNLKQTDKLVVVDATNNDHLGVNYQKDKLDALWGSLGNPTGPRL